MAPVRAPHRGDARGMARNGKPIMDRGPDSSTLKRRIALPLMPCDQQENTVASCDRPLQGAVDRFPSAIKAMAVQIQRPVRLDPSAPQAAVPSAIQRRFLKRFDPIRSLFRRAGWRDAPFRFR